MERRLVDEAIALDYVNPMVTFLKSLTIFGQKQEEDLNLGHVVYPEHIHSVSIHFGLTLAPELQGSFTVLWSLQGVEEWVSPTGTIFPALGMFQCANH